MSPYLVLILIFNFFLPDYLFYPMGSIQMLYQTTSQPVNLAICILLFCQLYLVILLKKIKIIIIISIIIIIALETYREDYLLDLQD